MVHLQQCAVLVAFALLLVVNDASSAAPWSNVFKFPNLRTGSQASNALTFPAFVNNTLMLQLSTDVSSGFSYTLCLNRFAPPAAPIDLATGQVSFRGWTQTCALFMDSITTSQATKNLTFVATGWHYLAVFVNRAPSSGFMITVSATGSSCSLGTYSPDCTKPKLLPLYNLVLEPGDQMLVELPPVAPEQTLMLFTLTYSNGSPSGGVIMSLTNGNTPSATTKYYNFTGSTISGLAQSNPRSCNDPSCTYFGMIGNSANARGPAYLSSLTSAFGSDPMPPIMSVDKGEALTLIVSFSNITLNLQRYYQFGSSSDLSVGVMAWPPVAGAAVPSAILGFGSLPDSVSLGSPGNVAMIGSSAAAANTSLYYSVNGLSSNGVWYVGLNVTEFASPSARAVVWFNAICPSNCHGRNGVCNPQTHICSCAKGFGGPDCSATLNGDDEQQQEEEEGPLYASRERVSSRPSRAAMMKYPDVIVVSYDGPE